LFNGWESMKIEHLEDINCEPLNPKTLRAVNPINYPS